MRFWGVLITGMIIGAIVGIIYLIFRIHRFSFIGKIARKSKILAWLASVGILAVIVVPFLIGSTMSGVVVLLHMLVITLICDLVGLIANKCMKRQKTERYYAGAVAAVISFLVLAIGAFNARHVRITRYELETSKNVGDGIRVAALADSHLGYTLSGEKFAREMEKLQEYEPDMLFIVGDFVDDSSTKEDMMAAVEALGKLKTRYGIYYVRGNHDRGYYSTRGFSYNDMYIQLRKNGVTILEDKLAEITLDDTGSSEPAVITIVGRKDRSDSGRKKASEIMAGVAEGSYSIMLDHQPNDYAQEAEAGPDLVLSGHTHGGQLFPANIVGLAIGANDRNYGHERRENTDFIVTSGIAEWAIPFKTCTYSEIILVDIR